MTKQSSILTAAMALALTGTPALATGVTKTWVSSTTGNDSGTCQFTSPCKTFAFAITQTLAGGEIDVKDGGSYGPVTINQAVSIVSEGVVAQISVPQGGTGVTVAAGPYDNVILQGLVIDGHNVGVYGVDYHGGASLTLQQCQIRNVTTAGLELYDTAKLYHLLDTTIANTSNGISLDLASGTISGSLYNVSIFNSSNGMKIARSNVTVIDSTFSGNQTGILSLAGGNVLLGQSTVSGNSTYGIQVNDGGIVGSYGNNYINANGTDIFGGSLGAVAER